jgi:hypothetical protein
MGDFMHLFIFQIQRYHLTFVEVDSHSRTLFIALRIHFRFLIPPWNQSHSSNMYPIEISLSLLESLEHWNEIKLY